MIKLLIILLLISCSKHKPKGIEVPEHLTEKAALYCDLAYEKFYLQDGYVHSKCDGSGFTSLFAKSCPHLSIDLTKFEDGTGKLHRDPDHSCFELGEAKSESSRDMTIMRMTAAWHSQDLAWVERFIEFAENNRYKICDAIDLQTTIGRCYLSYGLISLLYSMRSKLRDMPVEHFPEDADNEKIPIDLQLSDTFHSEDAVWDNLQKEWVRSGFRAHLDILRIDLTGSVHGYISSSQKRALRRLAERETNNALYQMMWAKWGDGDFNHVFSLISDERHWPHDKLPNNHDNHCTTYLYQRDEYNLDGTYSQNWLPCKDREFEEHPGQELPFTLSLLK